jgi:branched-chain amino acid aminotransferase
MYSSVPLEAWNGSESSDEDVEEGVSSRIRSESFVASDTVISSAYELPSHPAHAARQEYVQDSLLEQYRKQNGGSLGFGKYFTDHMMTVSYSKMDGWSTPMISGLRNVQLHPAAQVLHYGMSCFEGMKAYRRLVTKGGRGVGGADARSTLDGNNNKYHDESLKESGSGDDGSSELLLFRPNLNVKRLLASAARLHLPSSFSEEELVMCLKNLVRMDAGWVPQRRGEALYIRPALYAVSDMLGVSPPEAAMLNVIMSPSGAYFDGQTDGDGIRLFFEERFVRAWEGGAGNAKVGGNYAPTIYPQAMARERYGVDQVVYTRNGEVEECGAMNIFFVFEDSNKRLEIATPALTRGTILPGVTRASILEIARHWANSGEFEADVTVNERVIRVEEVVQKAAQGNLKEVFACGTASVIQPVAALVRSIKKSGRWEEIAPLDTSFSANTVTRRLCETLVDIQHGVSDDPRFASWTVPV